MLQNNTCVGEEKKARHRLLPLSSPIQITHVVLPRSKTVSSHSPTWSKVPNDSSPIEDEAPQLDMAIPGCPLLSWRCWWRARDSTSAKGVASGQLWRHGATTVSPWSSEFLQAFRALTHLCLLALERHETRSRHPWSDRIQSSCHWVFSF